MKMFSDCSGPCHTCAASGGCLAGHGDDHYQRISKEEARRRLKKRKSDGGRPYNRKELADISDIAEEVCPAPLSTIAQVAVRDLQTLAGIGCEHVARGERSCDEADMERGGCCNSCWASRWAKGVLKGIGWDV